MPSPIEAHHNGVLYRLCKSTDPLPKGTVVYAMTVPMQNWDMLTTLLRGVVTTERVGAISVRWDDGIHGTLKKEYVCVLCPRE